MARTRRASSGIPSSGFDRLIDEHQAKGMSYAMVRDYMAVRGPHVRVEEGRGPPQAFIPQTHRPGDEVEVDFGDVWIVLGVDGTRGREQCGDRLQRILWKSAHVPANLSQVAPNFDRFAWTPRRDSSSSGLRPATKSCGQSLAEDGITCRGSKSVRCWANPPS